jgi:hypothetical protein
MSEYEYDDEYDDDDEYGQKLIEHIQKLQRSIASVPQQARLVSDLSAIEVGRLYRELAKARGFHRHITGIPSVKSPQYHRRGMQVIDMRAWNMVSGRSR